MTITAVAEADVMLGASLLADPTLSCAIIKLTSDGRCQQIISISLDSNEN